MSVKRFVLVLLLAAFFIHPAVVRATSSDIEFNFDDVYLLGQLMEHEARSEGTDGLTAVAEVVYNRAKSGHFPNTIREVVFQKNQFTDAEELEDIYPSLETLTLAEHVLRGRRSVLNDDNILFFRNAKGSTDDWGKYKYELSINHHQFYSY